MKLLTFLGVTNYEPTAYIWKDREHTTRFSPVASCAFLQPEELIVFLTEEAQQTHFETMRMELSPTLVVHSVPVPRGQSEQELWQIFDHVSAVVNPGEEVAFDITNGLRSFPLLGLLVAAFLQNGLGVNLKAVFYGAFDVRDRSVTPNRTPMFDLSPMLALLTWSAAADSFNQTGDARRLAKLLDSESDRLGRSAGKKDHAAHREAQYLRDLAAGLSDISQSLRLIRPLQTMEQISQFPAILENSLPVMKKSAAIRPFQLLMERIQKTYLPLELAGADSPENFRESLVKQRKIIHWYIEREQWVQAITLAREWLINWFLFKLGHEDLLDKKLREDIAERMNSSARQCRNAAVRENIAAEYPAIPEAVDALKIWGSLIQHRNDIDHAGFRQDPGDPRSLVKAIIKLANDIEKLPI